MANPRTCTPQSDDRYHFCDDALRRFWAKVDKQRDGCWLWTAKRTRGGYGHYASHGGMPSALAHRYAYTATVGPVPSGLQLDHLCRVRNCVNPAHLEPVTPRENLIRGETFAAANARKTECPLGHGPYDMITSSGSRWCKTCRNAAATRQRVASPDRLARYAAEAKRRWREDPEYRAHRNAQRRAWIARKRAERAVAL